MDGKTPETCDQCLSYWFNFENLGNFAKDKRIALVSLCNWFVVETNGLPLGTVGTDYCLWQQSGLVE